MKRKGFDAFKKQRKGSAFINALKGSAGMITVEVSVIAPLLFFLTAGILFFQFFVVDMAAGKSEAMHVASRTAAAWKTGKDPGNNVYKIHDLMERSPDYLQNGEADRIMKEKASKIRIDGNRKRYILVRNKSGSLTIQKGIVRVSRKTSFNLPFRGISRYMGVGGWSFTCRQSAVIDNWQEGLRQGNRRSRALADSAGSPGGS